MRAAQVLLNATKKKSGISVPLELAPLFVAMGAAVCSAAWFSYKHLTSGGLRIRENPNLSALDKVLQQKDE
ncbi:AGL048Cp [Eremothecium gossypii ATCC 10895]|uniref:AGL048Cp n=1 Tax=Eremothecium gossypii (strain ATCC 10895 / CBS 109.51 / FGSC 9923 / NRRL Y-1056) TaxID=284811 RepID=D8FGG4_EREGS|nr:AGL048Cp [Eremothecium gossypii ATCC 10895]ADJ41741.1 AGL048Cp [Eremothecium gossypii ATCC 10895]AEY98774.1 FAGL048Cp [Eremothecium gossypii FDAG1]